MAIRKRYKMLQQRGGFLGALLSIVSRTGARAGRVIASSAARRLASKAVTRVASQATKRGTKRLLKTGIKVGKRQLKKLPRKLAEHAVEEAQRKLGDDIKKKRRAAILKHQRRQAYTL